MGSHNIGGLVYKLLLQGSLQLRNRIESLHQWAPQSPFCPHLAQNGCHLVEETEQNGGTASCCIDNNDHLGSRENAAVHLLTEAFEVIFVNADLQH